MEFSSLEELRGEIIDIVETRTEQNEWVTTVDADRPFHFIQFQMVVFDSLYRAESPEELAQLLPALSPGSIFYHFIDARRRNPSGVDDLRVWLSSFGERWRSLADALAGVDPYFTSLTSLREKIHTTFQEHLEKAAS